MKTAKINNDILDLKECNKEEQDHNEELINSIQWWKNKRRTYNKMLLSIAILHVIGTIIMFDRFSIILLEMLEAGLWIFGLNIFYSLGLWVEVSIKNLRDKDSETVRITIFICSLIFSGLITIYGLTFNSYN